MVLQTIYQVNPPPILYIWSSESLDTDLQSVPALWSLKKTDSEIAIRERENEQPTLMTSNGCVASVAIAPAEAADNPCITVASPFDFGGMR